MKTLHNQLVCKFVGLGNRLAIISISFLFDMERTFIQIEYGCACLTRKVDRDAQFMIVGFCGFYH